MTRSSEASLCTVACRPGEHHHCCQYCGAGFVAKRSDTRYCPARPGAASRLSECARRANNEANKKQCALVYPEGDRCSNPAQPGLKDGYCSAHHRRSVNGLPMGVRIRVRAPGRDCKEPGCAERHYAKGWCKFHWTQNYEGRATTPRKDRKAGIQRCSVEVNGVRCQRKVRANGLCDMHNQRFGATGKTGSVEPLKAKSGEGHLNDRGYVVVQQHGKRYMRSHAVLKKAFGTVVDTANEEVHHRNSIPDDDRPENLEVRALGHGAGANYEDLIPFLVDQRWDLIELYRRDGNCEGFPSWARKT